MPLDVPWDVLLELDVPWELELEFDVPDVVPWDADVELEVFCDVPDPVFSDVLSVTLVLSLKISTSIASENGCGL